MKRSLRSTPERFGGWCLPVVGVLSVVSLAGCGTEEEYRDSRLGVTVESLDPALANRWGTEGVVIAEVGAGSALEVGDLVTHLAYRTPASSDDELRRAMRQAMGPRKHWWQIGQSGTSDGSALLEVERDGATLYVELAMRDPRDWDEHGAAFENLRVTTVDSGFEGSQSASPARTSGLLTGDRVVAVIDEDLVPSPERFRESIARAPSGAEVFVYTRELTGIRLQAMAALGETAAGKPAVRDRLLGIMVEAKDPATRRTAARALERLASAETERTLLDAMLSHLLAASEPDEQIRRSAATTIRVLVGQLGRETFQDVDVETIARAMEDEDPGVHFAAGAILSEIGPAAVPVLTTALETSTSLRVRDIAATALGNIGGETARDALIGTLPLTEDVPLQLTIATALSTIGDAPARRALQELAAATAHSGLREFVRQLLEPVTTGSSGS